MPWTPLDFGKKHRGKTLPQVLFTDPDWFFWACENGVFDDHRAFLEEARLIHARSTSILIPQHEGELRVVEYVVHQPTGKFLRFDLVESNRPQEATSSTFRSEVINMSFPRAIAPYDKRGCRSLVKRLKYHLFGNESARMAKDRCEAFFDDLANFRESGE